MPPGLITMMRESATFPAKLLVCCSFVSLLSVWSAETPQAYCQAGDEGAAATQISGSCSNPEFDMEHERVLGKQNLPLQFSARINRTSHRIDASQEYPPSLVSMRVWYDQPAGRLRVDEIFSPQLSTTLIRRFDKGYSTMTTRVDKKSECRQSKIAGDMQLPEWPTKARLVGTANAMSILCQHWQDDYGTGVVDLYMDAASGAPVQVTIWTREGGALVKDITYVMFDFSESPPPDSKSFNLPKAIKGGLAKCERVPNDIGFPYVHFFHFYFRA